MRRAKSGSDVTVIFTALILIFDPDSDGRSGAHAVKYATQNFAYVLFLALGSDARLAGLAAAELRLNKLLVDREAGGTAVDYHANSGPVRFTKRGDAKDFAVRISH